LVRRAAACKDLVPTVYRMDPCDAPVR
jgi:hypothetical protein